MMTGKMEKMKTRTATSSIHLIPLGHRSVRAKYPPPTASDEAVGETGAGLLGLVDQSLMGDRSDEFGVTLVSQSVGDVWMHGVLLGMSSVRHAQRRLITRCPVPRQRRGT
jgi:tetrahydromethanopterin S-methyltransferase subunit D